MRSDLLLGCAIPFLWGLGFLVPYVLPAVDPLLLTAARYAAYGTFSLCLLATRSRGMLSALTPADWLNAAAFALAGNVAYYGFVSLSVSRGGVAVAAVVVGALPITVTLYGCLREASPPPRGLVRSLGLVAVGLAVVCVGRYAEASNRVEAGACVRAAGFAAAALACWTWYGVENARFLKRRRSGRGGDGRPVEDAGWSAAVGACTFALTLAGLPLLWAAGCLPAGAWRSASDTAGLLRLSAAGMFLGVVVSWYATALWNRVSRGLPASLAGFLIALETPAGVFYATVADGRPPHAYEAVSVLFVLGGVATGVRGHRGGAADRERQAASARLSLPPRRVRGARSDEVPRATLGAGAGTGLGPGIPGT